MQEFNYTEQIDEELYRLFDKIMMERPEEVRKMYRQYFNWWQSIVFWNGELEIC